VQLRNKPRYISSLKIATGWLCRPVFLLGLRRHWTEEANASVTRA
jgi:hypothetical protein